jgi:alpha-ribazole phosphatase
MKGYRISFLRHGKTSANEDGIYIGRTDFPLSDNGRSELREKYKTMNYPTVGRVYSSPLRRCLETAEILFPNTGIMVADDLTEMDFGVFEGISGKDLAELDSFKQWICGGIDSRPPNGESGREVLTRCLSAVNSIVMNMMNDGITHAGVITHAGIISNILGSMGIPRYKPIELGSDFGEGYEVLVTAMMWQNTGTFELLGKIPGDFGLSEEEY